MKENKLNPKEEKIIEFHKRFANGEQYLTINKTTGEIEESYMKKYFNYEIYNKISPIIESLNKKYTLSDKDLYGSNGIVSILIPLQREYNAIKNKKYVILDKFLINGKNKDLEEELNATVINEIDTIKLINLIVEQIKNKLEKEAK